MKSIAQHLNYKSRVTSSHQWVGMNASVQLSWAAIDLCTLVGTLWCSMHENCINKAEHNSFFFFSQSKVCILLRSVLGQRHGVLEELPVPQLCRMAVPYQGSSRTLPSPVSCHSDNQRSAMQNMVSFRGQVWSQTGFKGINIPHTVRRPQAVIQIL